MAKRREQQLFVGMVVRLRGVNNIILTCGLQKGSRVRIAKIADNGEIYISFLSGVGLIPLGGAAIVPLSPLEQLAMAAEK